MRVFSRHTWALGVAHVAIVTILFTVFLSAPPVVAIAASFSRLPEDLRTMLSLMVLALLGGAYATLVIALTICQQRDS